jgi:hypothetical protein
MVLLLLFEGGSRFLSCQFLRRKTSESVLEVRRNTADSTLSAPEMQERGPEGSAPGSSERQRPSTDTDNDSQVSQIGFALGG